MDGLETMTFRAMFCGPVMVGLEAVTFAVVF